MRRRAGQMTAAQWIEKLSAVEPHEMVLLWPGEVEDQAGWSACQCSALDWRHCACPVRIVGAPLMVEGPSAFRAAP
jgi:hypothetical protein